MVVFVDQAFLWKAGFDGGASVVLQFAAKTANATTKSAARF